MATAARRGFQLSLWQMLVIVIYAGAGAAAMTPFVSVGNSSESAWVATAFCGSAIVPLVWAMMLLAFGRRGPARDWLICAFLFWSSATFLGLIGTITVQVLPQLRMLWRQGMLWGNQNLGWLTPIWAAGLLLAAGVALLLPRLIPGRCVTCGRRRRLRHGRLGREPRAACLACRAVFRRSQGVWRPVFDAGEAGP